MKLYLVRHGSANHPNVDPLQGLSKQGKKEAEIIAGNLSKQNLYIQKIYHSTKLRARETANILAQFIIPKKGVEEVKGLSPNDDIHIWADKVEVMDEDIMLVGHMPYMPSLVQFLTKSSNEDISFVNACTVCLEKTRDGWIINWVQVPLD